jgi:hypothetical protein
MQFETCMFLIAKQLKSSPVPDKYGVGSDLLKRSAESVLPGLLDSEARDDNVQASLARSLDCFLEANELHEIQLDCGESSLDDSLELRGGAAEREEQLLGCVTWFKLKRLNRLCNGVVRGRALNGGLASSVELG